MNTCGMTKYGIFTVSDVIRDTFSVAQTHPDVCVQVNGNLLHSNVLNVITRIKATFQGKTPREGLTKPRIVQVMYLRILEHQGIFFFFFFLKSSSG